MHGLLILLIGFAAFMYLVVPVLIRFNQKINAQAQFQPVDLATLPPQAAQYLWACQQALEAEGFQTVAHLSLPNQTPNVFPLLTLFMNRATGVKAMTVAMYAITEAGPKLSAHYVEFITRYADGRVLGTNNNGTLGAFRQGPLQDTIRLPQIQDPHRLLAIHCRRVERLNSAEMEPLPPPGTELAYQQEKMVEDYEEQVQFGRLSLDPKTGRYVPTWRGAYLMTWGLLWPVKPIRTMLDRRRSNAALQSLDRSAFTHRV